MSDERPPVRILGGIEVSADDADALDRDALLYGNAYVEVFETGLGQRIDPAKIRSGEVQILDDGIELEP